MLDDYHKAVNDAVMDGSDTYQNQLLWLLSDLVIHTGFATVFIDMLRLVE